VVIPRECSSFGGIVQTKDDKDVELSITLDAVSTLKKP